MLPSLPFYSVISTALLRNLYYFTPQSLRLCVAISIILFYDNSAIGEIMGNLGTQLGKSGVFDYPMWANAMRLSGGRTAM